MITFQKGNKMNIQEFIQRKNYSPQVKRGGIEYLIERWSSVCDRLPYTNRYSFDEYLGDVMTRKVLSEVVSACEVPEELIARIEGLDKIFRNKTKEMSECLYDNDTVEKYDWNSVDQWFYFRVPEERVVDWFPESVDLPGDNPRA